MGVMDACAAAMTRTMDWVTAWGTIDWLRDMVKEMDEEVEVTGNGLFAEAHLHSTKADCLAILDEAQEHLEEARQICFRVLEAL